MKIEEILAPWERGGAEPFTLVSWQRAELEWQREKRGAAIAVIEIAGWWRQIVIRFDDDCAAWWVQNHLENQPHQAGVMNLGEAFNPPLERLAFRAQFGLDRGFVARFVEWQDTRHSFNFSSVVALSGRVFLNASQSEWHSVQNDGWPVFEQSICDLSHIELQKRIQNFFAQLEGEAFGRQVLSSLSREAAFAHIFGLENGAAFLERQSELEDLMRKVSPPGNYGVPLGEENEHWEIYGGVDDEGNFVAISIPDDPRLQFWAEVFLTIAPLRFKNEQRKKAYVREFLDVMEIGLIYREALTQHEILENRLQLLEWARDHLPPEKYAEALKIEGLEA